MSIYKLGIGVTDSNIGVELIGTDLHFVYNGKDNTALFHASVNAFTFKADSSIKELGQQKVKKPGVSIVCAIDSWMVAYADYSSGELYLRHQDGTVTPITGHTSNSAPSLCIQGEDIYLAYTKDNGIFGLVYNMYTKEWKQLFELTEINYDFLPVSYPLIAPLGIDHLLINAQSHSCF